MEVPSPYDLAVCKTLNPFTISLASRGCSIIERIFFLLFFDVHAKTSVVGEDYLNLASSSKMPIASVH